jgi:hypothetical protein
MLAGSLRRPRGPAAGRAASLAARAAAVDHDFVTHTPSIICQVCI